MSAPTPKDVLSRLSFQDGDLEFMESYTGETETEFLVRDVETDVRYGFTIICSVVEATDGY